MWACIAWMPIANLYIVGRYIVVKGITAITRTSHFVVVHTFGGSCGPLYQPTMLSTFSS